MQMQLNYTGSEGQTKREGTRGGEDIFYFKHFPPRWAAVWRGKKMQRPTKKKIDRK